MSDMTNSAKLTSIIFDESIYKAQHSDSKPAVDCRSICPLSLSFPDHLMPAVTHAGAKGSYDLHCSLDHDTISGDPIAIFELFDNSDSVFEAKIIKYDPIFAGPEHISAITRSLLNLIEGKHTPDHKIRHSNDLNQSAPLYNTSRRQMLKDALSDMVDLDNDTLDRLLFYFKNAMHESKLRSGSEQNADSRLEL